MIELNQLIHGDNVETLKTFPDNCIDSIVTDPPYGLSFMNKHWDYEVPRVELWKECLRVLKPGGHLLSFAGTRTYHRMTVNIEDAGFEIRDMISWIYGSGFPKSLDIGKAIDKQRRRDYVQKAIDLGITPKSNASWRDWTIGEHSPSDKYWEEFKKAIPEEDWKTIEREVTGFGKYHNPNARSQWCSSGVKNVIETAPATPEAIQWNGWGTALKPACEPICVARKPVIGTVANNVLQYGTGGINIDGCRIEAKSEKDLKELRSERPSLTSNQNDYSLHNGKLEGLDRSNREHVTGRFPANIIFDEITGVMLDEMSGESKSSPDYRKDQAYDNQIYSKGWKRQPNYLNDKGGASRFFYCAKASKGERNGGLEGFEEISATNNGAEKRITVGGSKDVALPRANHHPTVKPLKLMQYLVRLVTPPNGICLDPFSGSGTTLMACVKEGFNYIGLEREADYVKIAEARIEWIKKQVKEVPEQTNLFNTPFPPCNTLNR